MPFPECERVIYNKNPLDFVIFQVRFPSILRIDSEVPAKFQDIIRGQYPLFNESRGLNLTIPLGPRQVDSLESTDSSKPGLPPPIAPVTYQFSSEDKLWQISLTRDFMALTCKDYKKWEDFKAHLEPPLAALLDQYSPSFCTRIGLRYRDVIVPSKLGLDSVAWSDLLKPSIAGELSSREVANEVQHVAKEVVIQFSDENSHVRILHGLAKTDKDEPVYLIDSDFFTDERTETNDVVKVLEGFNTQARCLFRWCIQDRLHEAMEPQSVPE
ncbi:MAG: TIGR04255 family protein [Pseudomonadota bacterium]